MKIEQAENGFVYTDNCGRLYIYKTLTELASWVEGAGPIRGTTNTVYAQGYSAQDLNTVIRLMTQGKKIDAIKLVRDMYTPRMGLKEAKEFVEAIVL